LRAAREPRPHIGGAQLLERLEIGAAAQMLDEKADECRHVATISLDRVERGAALIGKPTLPLHERGTKLGRRVEGIGR